MVYSFQFQIKGTQDSLTDFIFSKFYMQTHTETTGLSVEKGRLCEEIHSASAFVQSSS